MSDNKVNAPKSQYATDERVRATTKLALLLHGTASGEPANQ